MARMTIDPQPRPRPKGRFMPGILLGIVALGALASGCIQSHDPRDDGSRLQAPPQAAEIRTSSDSQG